MPVVRVLQQIKQCGVLLVLASAFASHLAFADTAAVTEIHFAPAVADFDFREFDDGAQLNREEGRLLGANLSVSTQWQHLVLEGALSYLVGDVPYRGQTQSGRPVQSRTDEEIWEGELRLGWRIYTGTAVEFRLYGGMGYRDWDRDIQSTASASGLFENYYWPYGLLGAQLSWSDNESSHWLFELQALRPIDPEIEVQFKADLDNTRLELGEETGYRAAAAWHRMLSDNWGLGVRLDYTAWDIGGSKTGLLRREGIVIGTVYEPESETRTTRLQLVLVYRF